MLEEPDDLQQEANALAAERNDPANSEATDSRFSEREPAPDRRVTSDRRVSKFDVKPETREGYMKTEGVGASQHPQQPMLYTSQPAGQFANPQLDSFTVMSQSPTVAYAPSSFPSQHAPQDVVYPPQPMPTSVSFHQQRPPPPFEPKPPTQSVVFAPQVAFAPRYAPSQTVTFTTQGPPPPQTFIPQTQQQVVLSAPAPVSGDYVQQGAPPNTFIQHPQSAPQMGNFSQPPPGVTMVSMAQQPPPPPANTPVLIVSHTPCATQQITLVETPPQITTLHPMPTTLVLNAPPGQQSIAMPTISLVNVPNVAGAPPPGVFTSAPSVLVTTVSMATVPPGALPPQTVTLPPGLTVPPVGATLHNVTIPVTSMPVQLQLPNLAPPQTLITNPVPPQYTLAPPPNLPPPPAATQTFLSNLPPLPPHPPAQYHLPPPTNQHPMLPLPPLPPLPGQLPPGQYPHTQTQLRPPTFPCASSLMPPALPVRVHPSPEKYDPMDPTEGYDPTNPTDGPEDDAIGMYLFYFADSI